MNTRLVALALSLVLLGALASTASAAPRKLRGPQVSGAWAAELVAPAVARSAPRPRARRVMVLSPVGAIGGDATAMLITGSRTVRGTQWVRILLPKRPNGRQAWIRADHARIVRRRTRIEINRARRVLTLFRGRRAIVRTKVAIGRNGTPTPRGMHAVAEVVNTYSPGSYLGPRVLVLSAHSETINYFRGGRGRVAIHGTDRPQLLGTQASLGCIRVGNANILRLARLAPPGTPVRVR